MNIVIDLSKWFWLCCIAVIFLNAVIFHIRAKRQIKEHPELREGYAKIIKGFVIWASIPYIVMGVGCTIGGVPSLFHYIRPGDGDPFVIAFFVSAFFILGLATYWLFARGGAEMLARHPGILNHDVKNPLMIKLFWLLCLVGSIVGFLMMLFMDFPLPK